MAIYKQGINSSSPNSPKTNPTQVEQYVATGRVLDIVLTPDHPRYEEVGRKIGTIFFQLIPNTPEEAPNFQFTAIPLNYHTTTYPLIDEIVSLIKSSDNLNNSKNNKIYYYTSTVNMWNTPNHNAFPEVDGNNRDTFIKAQLNSPSTPIQDKFVELSNIRGLLPKMGDIIIEGRNGQSIRFSNENGTPITILRNGQDRTLPNSGFENINESIRNDLSSIYLTSTQQLKDFNVAGGENYNAFPKPYQPQIPSQFSSPQIILNSDRIVIDAQDDSILLSAKKVVSISVGGSVGVTTPSFYVGSNIIRLGGNDAKEPILKGNITVNLLKDLVEAVDKLAAILQVEKNWPQGAPITTNNRIASNTRVILKDLLNQLNLDESKPDSLKSYTSKVK